MMTIKGALLGGLAVAAFAATPVLANGDSDERVPPVANTKAKKECGACHMAFQPAFLPAGAWQAMMNNLDNHFGENAFLMPEAKKTITTYYTDKAPADPGRPLLTPDGEQTQRITETVGWINAHEDEVRPGAYEAEDVGSKANCPACHREADKGIYDDD